MRGGVGQTALTCMPCGTIARHWRCTKTLIISQHRLRLIIPSVSTKARAPCITSFSSRSTTNVPTPHFVIFSALKVAQRQVICVFRTFKTANNRTPKTNESGSVNNEIILNFIIHIATKGLLKSDGLVFLDDCFTRVWWREPWYSKARAKALPSGRHRGLGCTRCRVGNSARCRCNKQRLSAGSSCTIR